MAPKWMAGFDTTSEMFEPLILIDTTRTIGDAPCFRFFRI